MLEKVVTGQVCHCDTNKVWKVTIPVVLSLLTFGFFYLLQSIQINKILSNALEWGVKILYIDGTFSLSFLLQYTNYSYFRVNDAIHLLINIDCCRCYGVPDEAEKEGCQQQVS